MTKRPKRRKRATYIRPLIRSATYELLREAADAQDRKIVDVLERLIRAEHARIAAPANE